jgi:hypothetical protein
MIATPARAQEGCAEGEIFVDMSAETFGEVLRVELVRELASLLEPRAIAVCAGSRELGPGAELTREEGGPIRIRVWREGDPRSVMRPEASFDPSALPPDAIAFALARAVDELLTHAEVVPREAAVAPIEPEPEPEPAIEIGPGPEPPIAPEVAEIAWMLGASFTARFFSTEDVQLGGALTVQLRAAIFAVFVDLHASRGISRRSPLGSVRASLFGGSIGVLARASDGVFAIGAGPLASVQAAYFEGRSNDPSRATATGVRATFFAGARLQLEWSPIDAITIFSALDAQGVAIGAEGRDDRDAISRIDGFVFSASFGLGANLR